jgi:hypothetical protein
MLYLTLLLYALVDGAGNAITYSCKGANAFTWNEHIVWVIARLLVIVSFVMGAYMGYHAQGQAALWMGLGIEALAGGLAFSFFHNGIYAETRDEIGEDKYSLQQNWKYSSPTDTSRFNFTYKQRLWMFICSLVLMALYLLLG